MMDLNSSSAHFFIQLATCLQKRNYDLKEMKPEQSIFSKSVIGFKGSSSRFFVIPHSQKFAQNPQILTFLMFM